MKTPRFCAVFSVLHLSSTHFGAGGVTRTHDLWLLVRMHTGDLLMIFRHSQHLLCNSILHNHALVDIYLVKENCTIKLLVRISVML